MVCAMLGDQMSAGAITAEIPGIPTPSLRHWWWLIAVGAVVVAAVVAAVVVLVVQQQQAEALSRSKAAYASAIEAQSTAVEALAIAVAEGTALLDATPSEQLAEPAARIRLAAALEAARDRVPESGAGAVGRFDGDPAALDAARVEIETVTAEGDAARDAIRAAMDVVTRSHAAKALADARAALVTAIGSAEQVYAETVGRVADDGLRVELQVRIDAGNAVLGDADATAQTVQASAGAITEQATAVSAARAAIWQDVNGTWCAAKDPNDCVTVALPTLAGEPIVDSDVERTKAGCFRAETKRTGFMAGSTPSALTFCPAGLAYGVTNSTENVAYDRLVLDQRSDALYYRDAEVAAATASS